MKIILGEISYSTCSKKAEYFLKYNILFLPFLFQSRCYDPTHAGSASSSSNVIEWARSPAEFALLNSVCILCDIF